MDVRPALRKGLVIPAHPLAVTARRKLDERRQRALTRYYLDAGAGGLAVGVHTTQFAIHDSKIGLLEPVLSLAIDTAKSSHPGSKTVMIAGAIGKTRQAVREATLARDLGYHAVLLSLGAMRDATLSQLIAHARAVSQVLPLVGFYLQPAVGGRVLDYRFWRKFAEIDGVVAIKVAPFDRYATLEVVRALHDSGRANEISLYTGNDDQIMLDLLTRFPAANGTTIRFVGGLLGQWACWTKRAVETHAECAAIARSRGPVPSRLLTEAAELTEANSAVFDAANGFAGCIAGIHEVLKHQGLMSNNFCLDPREVLSDGQRARINQVRVRYPHLTDDAFVAANLDRWLRP